MSIEEAEIRNADNASILGANAGSAAWDSRRLEAKLNEGVIITKHLDGTVQYNCPVCDRQMKTIGGFGPHSRKHREDAGLVPKRKARPKKKSNKLMDEAGDTPPTPPKPEKKPTVEEGCLALIAAITGRKSVPLDQIPDVYAWITHTKEFFKEIK